MSDHVTNIAVPRTRIRSAATAIVAIAVTALSILFAPAASAAAAPVVYLRDPGATCYYEGYSRTATVRTPVVYAIDYNAGSGNDWQWVHFRSRLVDNATGATVRTNSWSAWSAAYDNRAAAYSGEQSIGISTSNVNSRYRVLIDIEWWSQTQRLYANAFRIPTYNAYVYFNGPYAYGWQPSTTIQTTC